MRIAWIALALCLAACSAENGGPDYTLYLVRHAEKMADDGDPELSASGHTRSARLAGWVQERGVDAIWSSNTRRTMQTAAPVQAALGLPIQRYDPADLPALAASLRTAGQDALVVGHSNTTPQLATLLCGCQVPEMNEAEYDRIIVVEMRDDIGTVTMLRQDEAFGQ